MAVPRFKEVPDHWRYPIGPYRQAPPEFGGEWWMVNPFTTEEPWKNQAGPAEQLPEGFAEIFGPRPKVSDYLDTPKPSESFRIATLQWEQDVKYFKTAGVPEWAKESEHSLAEQTFRFWEMGSPRFYEGRYGFMARFPESLFRNFEAPAWAALRATHHEVAAYQIRSLNRGIVPTKRHPFVPPQLWPKNSDGPEVA